MSYPTRLQDLVQVGRTVLQLVSVFGAAIEVQYQFAILESLGENGGIVKLPLGDIVAKCG